MPTTGNREEAPGSVDGNRSFTSGIPGATPGAAGARQRSERPPAAGTPAAAAAEKSRDPLLDNAKYLTILLVGIGHFLEPLTSGSRTTQALYLTVYAFHMPAFVLVSGYLSRNQSSTPRQIRRLISGVLLPYLIFQTLYTLFMRWAADDPDRAFAYHEPGYALWFLLALFAWRLSAPLWQNLRYPVVLALVVAVAASVAGSLTTDFSAMRILQFLPFFVLGMRLEPRHLALVRRRWTRPAAALLMASALVCGYWAAPRMDTGWFGRSKSAEELGVPAMIAATMVLLLFLVGAAMTAAFLALVPRRGLWCTALGSGTLYAYVLHIFVVKSSREFDWYGQSWLQEPAGRIVVVVGAAALMTVLCTGPVRRSLRWLVEPRAELLFRTPARST